LNKNLREIINKNLWLQKIPSQYIENYLEKINNKDINISLPLKIIIFQKNLSIFINLTKKKISDSKLLLYLILKNNYKNLLKLLFENDFCFDKIIIKNFCEIKYNESVNILFNFMKIKQDEFLLKNKKGYNILDSTFKNGKFLMAKFLFEKLFNYNKEFILKSKDNNGNNLFLISIYGQNSGLVKFILNKKIFDINSINNNGENALIISCLLNNFSISKILIENCINYNHKNNLGFSAIFYSCLNKNKNILQLLIEKSNYNLSLFINLKMNIFLLKDYEKQIYLNLAKIILKSNNLLELIFKNNNDYNKFVIYLFSYIPIDIENLEILYNIKNQKFKLKNKRIKKIKNINLLKNKNFIEFLHNYKYINIKIAQFNFGNNFKTAFCILCESQNKKAIEMFIRFGIDINLKINENSKLFPLMILCQKNNKELIQLLIDNNANVNLLDDYDRNILYYLTINNNISIIKPLLEKGIDINQKDKILQKTPFDIAYENEFLDLIQIFMNHQSFFF